VATFRFSRTPINVESLRQELADPSCGGYTSFEGLVRNNNEGMSVRHLEYEAFEPLAIKEGEKIVAEAIKRFGIARAACVHRIGDLGIGEMAVWVGASARHRDEAFRACRYIIDEVKHRVPVWKKEHYENGDSGWVNCERCAVPTAATSAATGALSANATSATAAAHSHDDGGHGHTHSHDHDHSHGGHKHNQSHGDHSHGRDHGHHMHNHGDADHAHQHDAGAHGPGDHAHEHEHRASGAGGTAQVHAPGAHGYSDADHAANPHGRGDGATGRDPATVPDYSRQIALKEVGPIGQSKLRAARVLVVGCGGLGVPVISYLAGAGIGRLGLVDSDCLEASNLHRQTMYALAEVGELKADLAAKRVKALNPDVDTRIHAVRLDATNAADLVAQYDLVIDCTDNFSTKFLLNDVCVEKRVPAIFSSVYQYEGQIQVVRPDGPCLRCIWPEATRDGIVGNCSEAGVLGPVPGTFGNLQAFEALRLLLNLPGQLGQELLMFDLLTMSISRLRTKRSATHPNHALTALATAQKQAQTQAQTQGGSQTGNQAPSAQGNALSSPDKSAADANPLELDFDSLEDAQTAGYKIIDVREPHELATVPTPAKNARHIPMAQLLYGTPPFKPDGKELLVCASGKRSLAAAQELRSRGATGISSLRGGIAKLRRRVPA
jgi:adenylyltransferase/sulfurtransferase